MVLCKIVETTQNFVTLAMQISTPLIKRNSFNSIQCITNNYDTRMKFSQGINQARIMMELISHTNVKSNDYI